MYNEILKNITGLSLKEYVRLIIKVRNIKTSELRKWMKNSNSRQEISSTMRTKVKRMIVADEIVERNKE